MASEVEVGRAVRASGVPRSELFVTTKIWFDDLEPESVARRVDGKPRKVGSRPGRSAVAFTGRQKDTLSARRWRAFAEAKAQGKTRLIGVSNLPSLCWTRHSTFTKGAELFCNQVEYHPFLSQEKLLCARMHQADMLLNAYQPIARGKIFASDVLNELGRKCGRVRGPDHALRWRRPAEQCRGRSALFQARRHPVNREIFHFELSPEDMAAIHGLAWRTLYPLRLGAGLEIEPRTAGR